MENEKTFFDDARKWAKENNPEMEEASVVAFLAGIQYYKDYLKNQ